MFESLISVRKEDFQEIFNNFFEVQWIDVKKEIQKQGKIMNFDVFKIHLKNPDNINDMLRWIFKHILTFSWLSHNTIYNEEQKYKEALNLLIKYIENWKKSITDLEEQDLDKLVRLREIWEILLFFFIESLLESPILLSKIRLKTNFQMPIYWNDAIHISKNWDCLIFWESKITNSFNEGKYQSRGSLLEHFTKEKISEEISVITNNFDTIPKEKQKKLIDFISPYSNEDYNREDIPINISCFMWYENDDYSNFLRNKDETKYISTIYDRIISVLKYYWEEDEFKDRKIIFFLLPIPSIFELLKAYALKIKKE